MSTTKVSSITFPAKSRCQGNYAFGSPFDESVTRIVTAVRTRTGERLPKWKRVIAEQGNATTPLTAYYDTIRSEPSTWYYEIKYQGSGVARYSGSGDIFLAPDIAQPKWPRNPTIDNVLADNRARQQFYSKLRGAQTQFQGMVFAGELRETLRMIKSPAQALRQNLFDYFSDLKRKKRKDPRNWSRAIGGTYLEHAFGWKPLLHDIEDAYNAYQTLTNRKIGKMISGSAIVLEDKTASLNGISPGFNATAKFGPGIYDFCRGRDKLYEQCQVRYRGYYKAEVNASQWQNVRQAFGFNPEEFVPSVWELLPWSWLIDYFVNIGDLLNNAVTSTQGVKWVNRTQRRSSIHTGTAYLDVGFIQASVGYQNPVQGVKSSFGSFEVIRRELIRSPNSGIPMPRIEFGTPGSGQLSNIAALLGTAFDIHKQKLPRRYR